MAVAFQLIGTAGLDFYHPGGVRNQLVAHGYEVKILAVEVASGLIAHTRLGGLAYETDQEFPLKALAIALKVCSCQLKPKAKTPRFSFEARGFLCQS